MRAGLLFLLLIICTTAIADSSPVALREKTLQAVNACLQRHDVSSRACKKLNKDVALLVQMYKAGDKSVLPTLFQFTYLSDFYDEALIADPEGFLAAMSQLSGRQQIEVASGVSGGLFRLRNQEHFNRLRSLLTAVPDSAPYNHAARTCLRILERNNAAYLVEYFPPRTFAGRIGDFRVSWFSSEMYALGETPMWPVAADGSSYRLTYIPAFNGPTVISLSLQHNGSGWIALKSLAEDREQLRASENAMVSPDRAKQFLDYVRDAKFWEMSTEEPSHGEDGAEWILEAVQNGEYHVVVRWCPDMENTSPQDAAFANALRLLFELGGYPHKGNC